MRVLVVEDSNKIRQYVAKALKRSGYAVDTAADGEEGLELAQLNPYDAVVLDIMLPGLDGFSLLQQIRSDGRDTPVLFLTARDTVDDRVRGLKAGADDYLVKPFALQELLARVEVLCRRRYNQHSTTHRVDDLELDELVILEGPVHGLHQGVGEPRAGDLDHRAQGMRQAA